MCSRKVILQSLGVSELNILQQYTQQFMDYHSNMHENQGHFVFMISPLQFKSNKNHEGHGHFVYGFSFTIQVKQKSCFAVIQILFTISQQGSTLRVIRSSNPT